MQSVYILIAQSLVAVAVAAIVASTSSDPKPLLDLIKFLIKPNWLEKTSLSIYVVSTLLFVEVFRVVEIPS